MPSILSIRKRRGRMPEATGRQSDKDIIAAVSAGVRLALIARAFTRYAGLWLIVALWPLVILNWFGLVSARFIVWHWSICLTCVLLQVSFGRRVPIIRGRPLVVAAPVRGRWQASTHRLLESQATVRTSLARRMGST